MQEIVLTAKIKILPTLKQIELLDRTSKAYTDACNFVSDYVYDTKLLSQAPLQKKTYYDIRADFELRSQMACSVIRTVIAKYKSFISNGHEWTKPVFRKSQYDIVYNKDYVIKEDFVILNTIEGRIKIPYVKKGMEKWFSEGMRFGTGKLVRKKGKYFLHVPVTFETNETNLQDICNVVGVDRGISFIAVTYDSRHNSDFYSGKAVKQKRAYYKNLRAELQSVGTPSSRRRLKAIGQRENRWMRDVNHQVSKALVSKYDKPTLFVLEDLTGVRAATEKVRRKNRYVQVSWAFYDLEEKIKYKAALYGHRVINTDPRYTSQTCPMCGHTEKANRNKKKHIFCCKNCSYTSNDDRIGAMNLYRAGINYIVSEVPDTVVSE